MKQKRASFNLSTSLKKLITKQMLQRLPIAPAQVLAGNISQSLRNEIKSNIIFFASGKKVLSI